VCTSAQQGCERGISIGQLNHLSRTATVRLDGLSPVLSSFGSIARSPQLGTAPRSSRLVDSKVVWSVAVHLGQLLVKKYKCSTVLHVCQSALLFRRVWPKSVYRIYLQIHGQSSFALGLRMLDMEASQHEKQRPSGVPVLGIFAHLSTPTSGPALLSSTSR
jgi:hypothetical protein